MILFRRTALALAFAAAVVILSACGDDSDDSSPASTPDSSEPAAESAAPAAEVRIDNFMFQPETVTIPVGTGVRWTNAQTTTADGRTATVLQTVTADDGSFDSGDVMQDGTFHHTFDSAGTFTYFCSIHPRMTATVLVE